MFEIILPRILIMISDCKIIRALLVGLPACGGLAAEADAGTDGTTSNVDASRLDDRSVDGRSVDANSDKIDSDDAMLRDSGSGDSGDSSSPPFLSCAEGGPGLDNCGASRESCCMSLEVTGGTFFRTYDPSTADGGVMLAADGGPTGEANPATVAEFRLDKYLVTLGRFRQFVKAWNEGSGYMPPSGAGKHSHLNGGKGLANSGSPGIYEPGWVAADNSNVAPTNTNLACYPDFATWTASAGSNENLPINCVNWYEADAFCIWDGGFLPSETEWEYAAAGGSQQREYPWGSTGPGTNSRYAIYGCYYPSGSGSCTTGVANVAPVGTATLGAGLWGQLDMAGDVFEWSLDTYTPYVDPCVNCAAFVAGTDGVIRGGYFYYTASDLHAPYRDQDPPTKRNNAVGFRCARSP
jgi:sulfatase modifying factor 1